MNLIPDNNILFSLMNPKSMNSFLFQELTQTDFFAPEFILEEFKKYEKECLKKSRLIPREFNKRKKEVFSRINFVEFSEFKKYVRIAEGFCPNENDVFYFALCLKLNIPLWSNDKLLKSQNKIVVLDTEDIIDLI